LRDLPRQLSVEELAELFERRTHFVELLAGRENPLGGAAEQVAAQLSEKDKLEALDAHPAIGGPNLSARSAEEQGGGGDAAMLTELAYLNQVYEEKFGFRFVVFVNRRPRSELLPVLLERLERSREEELATGLGELISIARDRWSRS
jgi:2-oxo-4-hydroxy-4-carboxy--5-ureidoimidazoline (OHCU) decarboxylase